MSPDEEEYTQRQARTLTSLKTGCGHNNIHVRQGSIQKPLLNLEPHDIVLDELHLFLRISDILIRNVISRVDALERRERHMSGIQSSSIQTLQRLVCSCGVSFSIHNVCWVLGICLFGYQCVQIHVAVYIPFRSEM